MNITRLNDRSAVPWWAAFGAPLVGVPLLVGLLAFGSVNKADTGVAGEVEKAFATERSDALRAGVKLPPVSFVEPADPRT